MNRNFNRIATAVSISVALGLGASAFAGSALSATARQPRDVVQYGDLNIATPAGLQTLSNRIENAAWQVCLQLVPPNNGPSSIANVQCRESLTLAAVAKVHNPALTSMFAGDEVNDSWRSG